VNPCGNCPITEFKFLLLPYAALNGIMSAFGDAWFKNPGKGWYGIFVPGAVFTVPPGKGWYGIFVPGAVGTPEVTSDGVIPKLVPANPE
jgi:hypothetical protein